MLNYYIVNIMIRKIPSFKFNSLLIFIVIFSLGIGVGYGYFKNHQTTTSSSSPVLKNTPKAFVEEVYDKIKDNYWNNISDAELLDLFKLSLDKNGGQISIAKFENKDKLLDSITTATSGMNEEAKLKFLTSVVSSVLSTLQPVGRSGLYTEKQEEQLKNTVANINPEKDLYKDLGLTKGASETAIIKAFNESAQKLSSDSSKEAKDQLKQLVYAKDTLTEADKKQRYDQNKAEPTIFNKVIEPNILYVQFKKFSPTSLDEFQKAFEAYKNDSKVNALILDLRGNIGGAIDATAYFLGFFLGKNQYAFDFYHKGEYLPFKTPVDKLLALQQYKQMVVLVDQNTQSSAELMAASLKRYHTGVVVGVPTKGWGTVERVFPLDNQISSNQKYSIFLVHSITLRDDNQPIEGRGVDPDVNLKSSDWEQRLFDYFRNPELINAIKTVSF